MILLGSVEKQKTLELVLHLSSFPRRELTYFPSMQEDLHTLALLEAVPSLRSLPDLEEPSTQQVGHSMQQEMVRVLKALCHLTS